MMTRLKNLESLLKERKLLSKLQHPAHKRLPNQNALPQIQSPAVKIINLSSCPCVDDDESIVDSDVSSLLGILAMCE
jgi:hypothetical protein